MKSHIPGTHAYRKSLVRTAVSRLSNEMVNYNGIANKFPAVKSLSVKKLRVYLKKNILIEERSDKLSDFLFAIILIPIGITLQLIYPFILNSIIFQYAGFSLLGFFLLQMIVFGLCTILILLPIYNFNGKEIRKRTALLQAGYLMVMVAAALYVSYNNLNIDNRLWQNAFFTGMYCSSLYFLSIALIFLVVLQPLDYFTRARKQRSIPESLVVTYLLKGLKFAVQDSTFTEFYSRRELMSNIENAAALIEKRMYKLLESFDKYNNQWEKMVYREMAYSLRKLKQSVIVPGSDSKSFLENSLLGYLQKIVQNDWAEIPRAPLPIEARAEMRKNKLLQGLKSFIIAVFPLGFLIVIKQYHLLDLPPNYGPYLTIVGSLWLVVNLLTIVDPNIKQKIASFKDVASLRGFRD